MSYRNHRDNCNYYSGDTGSISTLKVDRQSKNKEDCENLLLFDERRRLHNDPVDQSRRYNMDGHHTYRERDRGDRHLKDDRRNPSYTHRNNTITADANEIARQAMDAMLRGDDDEYTRLNSHVIKAQFSNGLRTSSAKPHDIDEIKRAERREQVELKHVMKKIHEHDDEWTTVRKKDLIVMKEDPFGYDEDLIVKTKPENQGKLNFNEKQKQMFDDRQQKKENQHHSQMYNQTKKHFTKCSLCVEGDQFKLAEIRTPSIISQSEKVVLRLKSEKEALVPYHSVLIPITHSCSTLMADEDVRDEIRNYEKCLIRFFEEKKIIPIFMEEVRALPENADELLMGGGSHTQIEVLPIPEEFFKESKIFFRKALDDAGSEWGSNKKLRNVPAGKDGLSSTIPAQFPFVHVDFALEGGVVQIVDDPSLIPDRFSTEILAGILDLTRLDRGYHSSEDWRQGVLNFKKEFKEHDWTQ